MYGPYSVKEESMGLCICPFLLGNGSVNTFPQQQRIFGGIVFYAVLFVLIRVAVILFIASC
jgi:hypothetical protein